MSAPKLEPGVSVCIATYRRPALLQRLLQSLARQTLSPETIDVIVVDNDPERSATETLASFTSEVPFRLEARAVPEPNIAKARNEGVRGARKRWLAFVDDDEWVEPEWLEALLRTAERSASDAVLGPVLPEIPDGAPTWATTERLYERNRHPTGTSVPYGDARTANALVSNATRRRLDLWFEPRLGHMGADDSLFFRTLERAGARLTWCDEAIVHETVLPERLRRGWLLRRAFRGGQSDVLVRRMADGFPSAAAAVAKGLVVLPPLLVAGLTTFPVRPGLGFRWLRRAFVQLGKVATVTPFRYREYRPPDRTT